MELFWPASNGEWMAWSAAAFTAFLGLAALFAPRLMLRVMRLQTANERVSALADVRASYGGFRLGLGLACLVLHPQPLLSLALGAAWIATAFGRFVSMLSDKGLTLANWLFLALELTLSALAFAYALGFVP